MSEQIHPAVDIQDDGPELSLLDLVLVLARHKKLVFKLTAAAAIVSAAVSFALPNIYTSTTKVLP